MGQTQDSPENQLPPWIPVIPHSYAGDGQDYTTAAYGPETGHETIHRPPDIDDRNAYAVRITNESMSPQLNGGDTVIVSQAVEFADDKVYLVHEKSGSSYIRQVRRDGDWYVLSSPNSSEKDFARQEGEIEFLHMIVWHVLG